MDFLYDINEQESKNGIVEVFTAFMIPKKPRESIKLNRRKDVHRDWTKPYNDFSLQALTNTISGFEGSNAPGERFYAQTVTLVQSSGMGKSRLMAEFGKRYPCMNFCLRSGHDGYHPPDFSVRKLFLGPIPKGISRTQAGAEKTIEPVRELFLMWAHALPAAYLQASFDYCWDPFVYSLFPAGRRNGGLTTSNGPFLVTQWINRNLEIVSNRTDLAMKWHNHHNQYTQPKHDKLEPQQGQIDAYERICINPKMLAKKFANSEAFQEVFS